jgi:predicted RND superfamily exporter protein
VVIVSDIRMLREFGLVTVIDLAVALIGVMLVLPAVLAYAERRARVRAAKRDRPARSEHLPGFAPGAGRPGGGPMTSRPSVTGRGS